MMFVEDGKVLLVGRDEWAELLRQAREDGWAIERGLPDPFSHGAALVAEATQDEQDRVLAGEPWWDVLEESLPALRCRRGG